MLAIGAGVCGVVVFVAVVTLLRFTEKHQAPPPPPPPPPPEQNVGRILRYKEQYYKASTEEDAKRWSVPAVAPAEMAQPIPYAAELTEPRALKVQRDTLDTPHLRISSRVIKEWASTQSGQRFRYEHIVLSITNKSEHPLAYLVDTSVRHPEQCRSQGAIAHNAIALKPGETVERTECLWHKDAQLTLKRVEVMELRKLSYYYVSRLNPVQVQLDARTAAGHAVPAPAKECRFVPWRDIQASAEQAGTGWADVIDFYARHNCDEYSFWRGYRRWTAPGALPSLAPGTPASSAPGTPPSAAPATAPSGGVDHPAASK